MVGSRDRIGIKPFYYRGRRRSAVVCVRALGASRRCSRRRRDRAGAFLRVPERLPAAVERAQLLSRRPPGSGRDLVRDRSQRRRASRAVSNRTGTWRTFTARDPADDVLRRGGASAFANCSPRRSPGQSLADVKVGGLLSGGFDSSTIVTLWSEIAGRRGSQVPDTLSIAWDDPEMSERPYIEAIAAKAGCNSHILATVASATYGTRVDDVVKAQAQPLLGQELIAQYHVYGLARQHGDCVVMDGNGLDEVQAGLPQL